MSDYSEFIFSVPLFHYEVRDWEDKKKKLKDLYNRVSVNKDLSYTVLTDYFRENKEENHYWEEIVDILKEDLGLFSQETNMSYGPNGHWFELSKKGMHHEIHNHGAVGYSCVLYIDYDEDEHTPTKFLSPFNNFFVGCQLVHTPSKIKSGSIIFFPSVIHHYTSPNTSDKERLILSFNLHPINC